MKKLTPMKAIRAKCLDCCCGQSLEVKECTALNCLLHFYRFGKNPNRKGIGSSKGLVIANAHNANSASEIK